MESKRRHVALKRRSAASGCHTVRFTKPHSATSLTGFPLRIHDLPDQIFLTLLDGHFGFKRNVPKIKSKGAQMWLNFLRSQPLKNNFC